MMTMATEKNFVEMKPDGSSRAWHLGRLTLAFAPRRMLGLAWYFLLPMLQ
jgi:hypothetical protein